MIRAAVVCPHPPLLLAEVAAGVAAEFDELRACCVAALRDALRLAPARVVVLGAGPRTQLWDPATPGCARSFGVPGEPTPVALPLSLTVGSRLLDEAGWAGPRVLQSIGEDADPACCAELGAGLLDGSDCVLLVMGDGSGVGRDAPPGAADPGAEPFDDAVVAALAGVDTAALLAIDPAQARRLFVAGRPAWQALAGAADAAGGAGWSAVLHHRSAPLGVGWFVASWTATSAAGQGA